MMISTNGEEIAAELARAAEQGAGLKFLLDAAALNEELRRALALVDADQLSGRMDGAGLQTALQEARTDTARYAAIAERQRRAEEAHTLRIAYCACGHSGSVHADRLTDDDRLPCRHGDCRCDDLAFVPWVAVT